MLLSFVALATNENEGRWGIPADQLNWTCSFAMCEDIQNVSREKRWVFVRDQVYKARSLGETTSGNAGTMIKDTEKP
jgi:hypothetical protein